MRPAHNDNWSIGLSMKEADRPVPTRRLQTDRHPCTNASWGISTAKFDVDQCVQYAADGQDDHSDDNDYDGDTVVMMTMVMVMIMKL